MLISACSSEETARTTTASKENAVNSGAEEKELEISLDTLSETDKSKGEVEKKEDEEEGVNGNIEANNTSISNLEQGNVAQGETIISTDLMNNIGETLHLGYTPDQLTSEFGEPNSVKTTMSEMMLYYSDAVYTVSSITNQVHIVSVQEGKVASFYENVSDVIDTYSEDGKWQLKEEIYDDEYHLIVQNSDYYMVFIADSSASKIKSFWVQKL